MIIITIFLNPYPRTCLLILERGEGREKERERNIDVREKHQLVTFFPIRALTGTEPTTQACALTGNRTQEPCGLQNNAQPAEPHQLGPIFKLIVQWY